MRSEQSEEEISLTRSQKREQRDKEKERRRLEKKLDSLRRKEMEDMTRSERRAFKKRNETISSQSTVSRDSESGSEVETFKEYGQNRQNSVIDWV